MSTATKVGSRGVDGSAVRGLLLGALVAFGAALATHHRLDPAAILRDLVVYPAVILPSLALWKRRAWLEATAAIVILVPALAFLDLSAFTAPVDLWHFLNHAFLLLAAALALMGVAAILISGRRKRSTA